MSDPNWTDVRLLLRMMGSNGSTNLPDEKAHVVNNDTVVIDTATADPFGNTTGVAYFGPSSQGLYVSHIVSDDLNLSNGNWTVEAWIRPSQVNTDAVLVADFGGLGWSLEIDRYNTGLKMQVNGSALNIFGDPCAVDAWTHIAGVRNGNVFTLYVNGVGFGNYTRLNSVNISSPARVAVGRYGPSVSRLFKGRMAGVRITKTARYTANFTPPTEAFPNTGETIISGALALPVNVMVVSAAGPVSLPLDVRTGPSGSAVLSLDVRTGPTGTATVGITTQVVSPTILSGEQSVCIGSGGSAGIWKIIVRLAGLDVSDQVIGDIRIEAEEGAARIAEFILRPPTGTEVSLAGWTGLPVEIDVADNSSGTPTNALRRFTGVVDLPALDQSSRTIALRCTDDLQGRLGAMTNAALASLIGGHWSPVVFDAAAIGWTYAQDRLSTVAASLDISPFGALRLTPWQAKTSADLVFDESILGDASIAPKIADRASIVNEVVVSFDYRFPRVKAECHRVQFDCVTMTNFAQYQIESRAFMQRAQVEAALEQSGGTIESISYVPLPTVDVPVGETGYWSPGPYDDTLCMGFDASVSFDYAQTTEEQHRIRVYNALSIAAVGLRSSTLAGALEGEYPDIVATETGIKLYKSEMTRVPPINAASVSVLNTTSVNATLTAGTDRAAANAAMETLIAIAKARIFSGHRNNRVPATIPFVPAVDLDKTIQINADGVSAKGKCVRTVDRLSPSTASAVTEFSIALCAIAGYGITHDADPTTAPAGTTAGSTPLVSVPTVVFNGGPGEDLVISITFPPVADEERGNAVVPMPSEIRAPINEDLFTITL